MQELPHHPLYQEGLLSPTPHTSFDSPQTSRMIENSPFLYTPYIPSLLPSPTTSYFQPVEVYRTLMKETEANEKREEGPISPPPRNRLRRNSTRYKTSRPFSEPTSPRAVTKPSGDAICPVVCSTTVPVHSPQPRRVTGLPLNQRRTFETGLGVTCPPPAVLRKQTDLAP